MIKSVLPFLPGITCLFWLVLNPMLHKRDEKFKAFQLFLLIIGTATLADAGLVCGNDDVMLSCFLTRQFFAPMVIPALLIYCRSLLLNEPRKPFAQAWLAIPVSLLFAQIILIMLCGNDGFIAAIRNTSGFTSMGHDKVERLIHFCTVWIFHAILVFEIILFFAVTLIRFKKTGSHMQTLNCSAIAIFYMIMETVNLYHGILPAITGLSACVILSIMIFMTSCSGLFHANKGLTFRDISTIIQSGTIPAAFGSGEDFTAQDIANANMDRLRASAAQQGAGETSGNAGDKDRQILTDEEDLRIRFENLIVTGQLFLRQGIRISDIATMLDTNRTYISRLVNSTYNMSFSDYINTLRIDYAQQYLLHDRDARQSDIAAACGFPNASAFNNVFKKITGVTPKIWLATRS